MSKIEEKIEKWPNFMKKITPFILLLLLFTLLMSCSYGKVQKRYLVAQQKVAELKAEKASKPLAKIKTSNGNVITVKDPRSVNVNIEKPKNHPAVKVWHDTVGLASSPLASVLGFGYAGKMLMEEAGDYYSNSNNDAGNDMQVGGKDNKLNKSDNRQNYNNQDDNSDNRQNYNNEDDNSDNRQNYNNQDNNETN